MRAIALCAAACFAGPCIHAQSGEAGEPPGDSIAQDSMEEIEVSGERPGPIVTQFGEIPREIQVKCLAAIVTRLEKDMDTIKAQADAWALGDVETLRKLPYPAEISVCTDALGTSERMKDMIEHINVSWNRAIDNALTKGPPTLAVKPIFSDRTEYSRS